MKSQTFDWLFLLKRFTKYGYYKDEIISRLYESKHLFSSNYCQYIYAIEPDIVGEYFVLDVLNGFTEEEYVDLITQLYQFDREKINEFFWRYNADFQNLASKHPGYSKWVKLVIEDDAKLVGGYGKMVLEVSFDPRNPDSSFKDELLEEEMNLVFAPKDRGDVKVPAVFSIPDEQGIETEYRTVLVFMSDETRRCYILYTDNSTDENGNMQIYASAFTPENGEMLSLEPIETEYEWSIIEEALREAKNQNAED